MTTVDALRSLSGWQEALRARTLFPRGFVGLESASALARWYKLKHCFAPCVRKPLISSPPTSIFTQRRPTNSSLEHEPSNLCTFFISLLLEKAGSFVENREKKEGGGLTFQLQVNRWHGRSQALSHLTSARQSVFSDDSTNTTLQRHALRESVTWPSCKQSTRQRCATETSSTGR